MTGARNFVNPSLPQALGLSDSGAELRRMIAENGSDLIFNFVGGGYGGPYPAAQSGDPAAIALRDAIHGYTLRLFEEELEDATCLLCRRRFQVPEDVGLTVAVSPGGVLVPTCICCSPVCTLCWMELPKFGELAQAVAQRYRDWIPDLKVTLHPSPGHA
jgi:hypothetical protein